LAVSMATVAILKKINPNAILNFINTPKASTHYGEYSYYVSQVWWKKSNIFKNPPFFLSPWQLRQSLSYRFRFFWLISFH
jgi:hypothetical protein